MGNAPRTIRIVGRYALCQSIAAGGMATVHLGRLMGPVGFSRTVAIKRLHAQFAGDPDFVSMFLDEARIATRIRHPNVVPTLDVVATEGELFLVMEYVPGESVARLSRALRDGEQTLPLPILSAIMTGVLHGLHAAHEAKNERGEPLGIVHRDVSPQNVLVGTDGVARLLDFGVAKAAGRMATTRDGHLKGKLSYMPPEQLRGADVTRQSDIYAVGVMLWELVTGQRLFGSGENEGAIISSVLGGQVETPSQVLLRSMSQKAPPSVRTHSEPEDINVEIVHPRRTDPAKRFPTARYRVLEIERKEKTLRELGDLDATILRALATDPTKRFSTAREMALEIERKVQPATGSQVADWVEQIAKDVLHLRAAMVAEIESSSSLVAAEPHDGHVKNLLSARPAPAPDEGIEASSSTLTAAEPRDGHVKNLLSAKPAPAPDEGIAATEPSDSTVLTQRDVRSLIGPAVVAPLVHVDADRVDSPVTQPSSISVATGHARSAEVHNGRPRAGLMPLIGVTLGVGVLVGVLVSRRPAPLETAAQATATNALGASAVPSETAPSPAAAPPATPDAAAAETSAKGQRAPAPTRSSRPAQAPSADCTPPYVFDEHHVKRYKPHCVE